MCEQCSAKVRMFSPCIVPNVRLVQATKDGQEMKSGDYGLVFCNDPSFIFSIQPEIEPEDNDSDPQMTEYFNWQNKAEQFREQLYTSAADLERSYDLVASCVEVGYNRKEGLVSYWLFNRIATMLPNGRWIEHDEKWPDGVE